MYIEPKQIGVIKFLRGEKKKMQEAEGISESTLRDRLKITDQDNLRSPVVIMTQVKAVKMYGGIPVDMEGKRFLPESLKKALKLNGG